MFTKRRQDKTTCENEIIVNKKTKQPKLDMSLFEVKTMNKKHQLFLCEAAKIAEKSNMLQKHGAIIVYKNKIIADGYNYICDYMNNNYSIHAEIAAISKIFYNKKILEECDIYVVRIATSSIFDKCLKNSQPCISCSKFIKKYNLRNIYYSTNFYFDEFYTLNI